jgi:SH3-like domain-containing protein
MLVALSVAILPWQAVAEVSSALPSNPPAQATGFPRRGIVTLKSHLRASPSTQSEIVTILKEGAQVEILAEIERWYRVRNDEGVEAWINKRLVLIQREPLKTADVTPTALTQADITEPSVTSAAKFELLAESWLENISAQQGSGASSAAPRDELYVLPDMTGIGGLIDAILPYVQGLGAYVIIALVVVLIFSIALQLRASRQLQRAMQEMGQIVDIVEEIYTGSALSRTSDTVAALNPMLPEAPAPQVPRSVFEFSPIECAVLEALSDQHEVQEGELGKVLDEKGFAGMLIKAVIGAIVRKTGAAGLPWVEVRYVQGRYSYRLRPEAVSSHSA